MMDNVDNITMPKQDEQDSQTPEVNTLLHQDAEATDPNAIYNKNYLETLRQKAQQSWQNIQDTDKWLRDIRGSYDA